MKMQLILASLLILLGSSVASASLHSEQRVLETSERSASSQRFNWTAIPPTKYLNYTPCYEDFECSRLEVPLDWSKPSSLNKIQIAIIRLPASVAETDPSFGGTILFNPGGPGGSGIDAMRWMGHGIRNVVDGHRHFEILSWDPRGIHYTTPSVSCFEDNFQREIWSYRTNVLGPMDASDGSLIQKWALAASLGQLCEQSNAGVFPDGSKITQFTTTALVARDMVEIVDQVGMLRSRNVQSPHERKRSEPELLNYWGFSYGSYLGNTFASMFPSRIGRIILDSVVDANDYTETGWFSNLQDHCKVLNIFYGDCFEAGSKCPLNNHNVTCPSDIGARIGGLLTQLKEKPIIQLHDETPDIVTFADVSSLLLSAMYFPRWSWPELAEILADLLRGNGTSMSKYLQTISIPGTHGSDEVEMELLRRLNQTNPLPPPYSTQSEASRSVLCGDGDDITNLTINDWHERLSRWRSQSPVVGWTWSENPLMCVHWPKSWRPADHNRFKGPWTSKLTDYDDRASPILLIGNSADPVTPLQNAFKSAASHEGARVLVQSGPGHCTGYVNPASCTWQHIKRFFSEGVLPENNTVCDRDGTPWSERH